MEFCRECGREKGLVVETGYDPRAMQWTVYVTVPGENPVERIALMLTRGVWSASLPTYVSEGVEFNPRPVVTLTNEGWHSVGE